MTERHTVIPRTLCFIFNGDDLLMIKGSTSKEWAGHLNPPGGHIEKGEDIVRSAEREIREETGLTPLDTRLRGVMHVTNFYGKDIMMFITSSTTNTKSTTASDEGELVWVSAKDIEHKKVLPDIKSILSALLSTKSDRIFTGRSEYDGKSGLLRIDMHPSG